MLNPSELLTRLARSGLGRPGEDIIGCSQAEIDSVENAVGARLPAAYKEFLRAAGKKAGYLFVDVDIYYPKILHLNQRALTTLSEFEGSTLRLPEHAFVFSDRYGEQFMFFLADQTSEDPPVFFYYQGQGYFETISNSVWDIIETELQKMEDFKRTFPDSPYWKYLEGRRRP